MNVRRLVIVGRFGRRWLWCALGAMLALGPGVASAQSQLDACTQTSFGIVVVSVPNCQSQQQAPISYTGWQTQGWAYYCTGDHPYFYHSNGSWVVDNSNDCWGFTENAAFEGGTANQSKLQGTFTNWCFDTEQLTVALACSDTPQ